MHYTSGNCNNTQYPNSRWAGHWNFLKKCTSNNHVKNPMYRVKVVPSRIVLGGGKSEWINYPPVIIGDSGQKMELFGE